MEGKETENAKTYGKFKSAEELLAAYNALEREFTKRCQLIKELKAAGEPACAQEDMISESPLSEAPAQQPANGSDEAMQIEQPTEEKAEAAVAVEATQRTAPTEEPSTTQEATPDDIIGYVINNAADCADLLSEIPQVMDACIAKYKQKLISMGATVSAVRGAAVITPVRRPKTLIEAKILADEMLR